MADKISFELTQAVHTFLFDEAELLDAWRIEEWLQFLDPNIRYLVPVRETRMKEDGGGFSTETALQDDDRAALETRARRLRSRASWSENPPTRIRHHISNIRITNSQETGGTRLFNVASNVIVLRTRGQNAATDIISYRRDDILSENNSDILLVSRTAYLDHTTINTHNLAFIL